MYVTGNPALNRRSWSLELKSELVNTRRWHMPAAIVSHHALSMS